ncbi:MAG: response regulator [Deltaproteobacteria bacterium]|jgi:CheY-like chemotaxis protein/cytidylate kinase|nr:response regulator [Deltaproteobacteria bacterium]
MPIITIFSGGFCQEDPVVQEVIARTGYRQINDDDIVAEASRRSAMAEGKIKRTFSSKTSVFNKFTLEKERSLAYIKLAVADMITTDNALITCFSGLLIPATVSHTLRVCLIAPKKFRTAAAAERQGISEKDAAKLVQRREEDCSFWIDSLFGNGDPWDPILYDIIIPVDKMSVPDAAALIADNAAKDIIQPTADSKQALQDFRLAAETECALVQQGHTVEVSAINGAITLTINKHVLMLNRLQEELKSIAEPIAGVKSVETKIGKDFHKTDIYRKHDFKMPSKVLLVDDEREFVHTLSERLMMRDMGSAVAYDGESALNLIKEDEPEVIIVDLKMPGIDGFDVLRRVKETRPEIEVIILTGHGSEEDRQLCMDLGAFAYLQKPLDINVISETIQQANEKIRRKKGQKD